MSSKSLKGLTIKIGGDTTELSKSLSAVENKSRSLSSELKHIDKLLKLDPTNTELLSQKQKVLADAISNTEKKLDTLKTAEKQVQEQFERGEASEEQVRALRREIIETTSRLERYKKATKETADAEEKLGKEADGAAEHIEEQGKKSKETEKDTEDLDDATSDLASGGLAALTAAALAAVGAVVALAEESREYRTEMTKLDTAYKSAGHSISTATKTYKALQGVIGETDQSVEAAQQIALLAESEKDAAEWAGLAAGLIGRLGDALQPETFYEGANETLKLNEATGAYVQLLEQCGRNVEEFNVGLEACTTKQEKQEYMLEITRQLLGAAAEQYRATNAEVIRANEATEKWNETTARIGSTVEPAVTDLKELGAALLDDVEEPLESIAGYVRSDVIPAIKGVSSWVKSNGPVIKGTIVGVTTAFVAYKAVVVSTTIAEKGLKGAIVATTVAQKALNLVQKASPTGLVVTAVVALTAALGACAAATKDAKKPVEVLTEEEKALAQTAREAAEAFEAQQTSTNEAFKNVNTEMGYVRRLATELFGLADASGRVQEKDQARADFIISQLNGALGTEYEMIGGLIQQYDTLKSSIDEVIASKTASLLLDELADNHVQAIQNEDVLKSAVDVERKNVEAKQKIVEDLKAQVAAEQALVDAYADALDDGQSEGALYQKLEGLQADLKAAEADLTTAQERATAAKDAVEANQETQIKYQAAMAAYLEGNYQQSVDIMNNYDGIISQYSTLDVKTAATLTNLQAKAAEMKKIADETKASFEAGAEGVTQEIVDQAKANYEAALGEFQNAYIDAYTVGEYLGDGLAAGMASRETNLAETAARLVEQAAIATMFKTAQINSPSKRTMKVGEGLTEGADVGMQKKAPDLKRTAAGQASLIIDTFREQEVNAQRALIHVADQQASRQVAGQMTAAAANGPMLERILAAIEHGQILVLDSDALVGGTVDKMDRALGSRRIMVQRGAR